MHQRCNVHCPPYENPFHPNGSTENMMMFGSPFYFPGELRPGIPFIVNTEGEDVTEISDTTSSDVPVFKRDNNID